MFYGRNWWGGGVGGRYNGTDPFPQWQLFPKNFIVFFSIRCSRYLNKLVNFSSVIVPDSFKQNWYHEIQQNWYSKVRITQWRPSRRKVGKTCKISGETLFFLIAIFVLNFAVKWGKIMQFERYNNLKTYRNSPHSTSYYKLPALYGFEPLASYMSPTSSSTAPHLTKHYHICCALNFCKISGENANLSGEMW